MPKRHFLKTISVLLILSFVSLDIAQAGSLEVLPNASSAAASLANNPYLLQAPLSHVGVREAHRGNSGIMLVHIQDAHSNTSGQMNLANCLEKIMKEHDIRLVLVEGAYKDVTLTPLKQMATSKEALRRTAKSFLMEGKIAGEEYLNLTSDIPMSIRGMEDKNLYETSVQAYSLLIGYREDTLTYLQKIHYAVDSLKKVLYPSALLDYEKNSGTVSVSENSALGALIALAKAQNIALDEYPNLSKIEQLLEKEKSIDFDAANLEQAKLIEGLEDGLQDVLSEYKHAKDTKASLLSYFQRILNKAEKKNVNLKDFPHLLAYVDYLKDFNAIDLEHMLKEKQVLEDMCYVRTLGDEKARLLRSIERYIGLLDQAFRIQMSSDEYADFDANEKDFSEEAYLSFLNTQLAEHSLASNMMAFDKRLTQAKSALRQFYQSVDERDKAFLFNAKRIMAEEGQKKAVFITGGYHTAHLRQLFKEQDYSYVVLSPIVTSTTNQEKYEKLLLEPLGLQVKKVDVVSGQALSSDKSLSDYGRGFHRLKKKNDGVRVAAAGFRFASSPEDLLRLGIENPAIAEKLFSDRPENPAFRSISEAKSDGNTVKARQQVRANHVSRAQKKRAMLNSVAKPIASVRSHPFSYRNAERSLSQAGARMAIENNVAFREALNSYKTNVLDKIANTMDEDERIDAYIAIVAYYRSLRRSSELSSQIILDEATGILIQFIKDIASRVRDFNDTELVFFSEQYIELLKKFAIADLGSASQLSINEIGRIANIRQGKRDILMWISLRGSAVDALNTVLLKMPVVAGDNEASYNRQLVINHLVTVSGVELGMDHPAIMSDLLRWNSSNDINAEHVVRSLESFSSRPVLAYLVLKRYADNKEFLNQTIHAEQLDFRIRLYANVLLARHHGEFVDDMKFMSEIRKMINDNASLDTWEWLETKLSNPRIAEDDLKVYTAAVIMLGRHKLGTVFGGADRKKFAQMLGDVMNISLKFHYDNVDSEFNVGVKAMMRLKPTGKEFLMIMMHEWWHRVLEHVYKYRAFAGTLDINRATNHEFLADLTALTIADSLGWDSYSYLEKVRAYVNQRRVESQQYESLEPHEAARAQLTILLDFISTLRNHEWVKSSPQAERAMGEIPLAKFHGIGVSVLSHDDESREDFYHWFRVSLERFVQDVTKRQIRGQQLIPEATPQTHRTQEVEIFGFTQTQRAIPILGPDMMGRLLPGDHVMGARMAARESRFSSMHGRTFASMIELLNEEQKLIEGSSEADIVRSLFQGHWVMNLGIQTEGFGGGFSRENFVTDLRRIANANNLGVSAHGLSNDLAQDNPMEGLFSADIQNLQRFKDSYDDAVAIALFDPDYRRWTPENLRKIASEIHTMLKAQGRFYAFQAMADPEYRVAFEQAFKQAGFVVERSHVTDKDAYYIFSKAQLPAAGARFSIVDSLLSLGARPYPTDFPKIEKDDVSHKFYIMDKSWALEPLGEDPQEGTRSYYITGVLGYALVRYDQSYDSAEQAAAAINEWKAVKTDPIFAPEQLHGAYLIEKVGERYHLSLIEASPTAVIPFGTKGFSRFLSEDGLSSVDLSTLPAGTLVQMVYGNDTRSTYLYVRADGLISWVDDRASSANAYVGPHALINPAEFDRFRPGVLEVGYSYSIPSVDEVDSTMRRLSQIRIQRPYADVFRERYLTTDEIPIKGQKLGEGGYAEAYAHEGVDGQFIKTINATSPVDTSVDGFAFVYDQCVKEIENLRTLAKSGVTGIPQIVELGLEPSGMPWILMKGPSGSAHDLARQRASVDMSMHLDIWLQMARVLQKMHDAGYIHGDVKPANSLFDEKSGIITLIDLASAGKIGDPVGKFTHTAFYTPDNDKTLTPAFDIYALGRSMLNLYNGLGDHLKNEIVWDKSPEWKRADFQELYMRMTRQDRPKTWYQRHISEKFLPKFLRYKAYAPITSMQEVVQILESIRNKVANTATGETLTNNGARMATNYSEWQSSSASQAYHDLEQLMQGTGYEFYWQGFNPSSELHKVFIKTPSDNSAQEYEFDDFRMYLLSTHLKENIYPPKLTPYSRENEDAQMLAELKGLGSFFMVAAIGTVMSWLNGVMPFRQWMLLATVMTPIAYFFVKVGIASMLKLYGFVVKDSFWYRNLSWVKRREVAKTLRRFIESSQRDDSQPLSQGARLASGDVNEESEWRPVDLTVGLVRRLLTDNKAATTNFGQFSDSQLFQEMLTRESEVNPVKPARLDVYIRYQSSYPEQALVELTTNALDASSDDKPAGRFGVGGYQVFSELRSDTDDRVILSTSDDGQTAHQLIFKIQDGQLLYQYRQIHENVARGTQIRVLRPFNSDERQARADYVKAKFRTNSKGRIILTQAGAQEVVNHPEDYIYLNGSPTPQGGASDIHIDFTEDGYAITDSGTGMSASTLFTKFLVPKQTNKQITGNAAETDDEVKKETKIFLKPQSNGQGLFSIAVSGVNIFTHSTQGYDVPADLVVELPHDTWMPDSRDDIHLDETSKRGLFAAVKKVLDDPNTDIRLKSMIINGLASWLVEVTEKTKDKKFYYEFVREISTFVKSAQSQGYIVLPNREEFSRVMPDATKRIYLDERMFEFNPADMRDVVHIKEFVSSEKYALYIVDMDTQDDQVKLHGRTLSGEGWVLLDRKVWDAHKEHPVILNFLMNLNIAYGDRGIRLGRVPDKNFHSTASNGQEDKAPDAVRKSSDSGWRATLKRGVTWVSMGLTLMGVAIFFLPFIATAAYVLLDKYLSLETSIILYSGAFAINLILFIVGPFSVYLLRFHDFAEDSLSYFLLSSSKDSFTIYNVISREVQEQFSDTSAISKILFGDGALDLAFRKVTSSLSRARGMLRAWVQSANRFAVLVRKLFNAPNRSWDKSLGFAGYALGSLVEPSIYTVKGTEGAYVLTTLSDNHMQLHYVDALGRSSMVGEHVTKVQSIDGVLYYEDASQSENRVLYRIDASGRHIERQGYDAFGIFHRRDDSAFFVAEDKGTSIHVHIYEGSGQRTMELAKESLQGAAPLHASELEYRSAVMDIHGNIIFTPTILWIGAAKYQYSYLWAGSQGVIKPLSSDNKMPSLGEHVKALDSGGFVIIKYNLLQSGGWGSSVLDDDHVTVIGQAGEAVYSADIDPGDRCWIVSDGMIIRQKHQLIHVNTTTGQASRLLDNFAGSPLAERVEGNQTHQVEKIYGRGNKLLALTSTTGSSFIKPLLTLVVIDRVDKTVEEVEIDIQDWPIESEGYIYAVEPRQQAQPTPRDSGDAMMDEIMLALDEEVNDAPQLYDIYELSSLLMSDKNDTPKPIHTTSSRQIHFFGDSFYVVKDSGAIIRWSKNDKGVLAHKTIVTVEDLHDSNVCWYSRIDNKISIEARNPQTGLNVGVGYRTHVGVKQLTIDMATGSVSMPDPNRAGLSVKPIDHFWIGTTNTEAVVFPSFALLTAEHKRFGGNVQNFESLINQDSNIELLLLQLNEDEKARLHSALQFQDQFHFALAFLPMGLHQRVLAHSELLKALESIIASTDDIDVIREKFRIFSSILSQVQEDQKAMSIFSRYEYLHSHGDAELALHAAQLIKLDENMPNPRSGALYAYSRNELDAHSLSTQDRQIIDLLCSDEAPNVTVENIASYESQSDSSKIEDVDLASFLKVHQRHYGQITSGEVSWEEFVDLVAESDQTSLTLEKRDISGAVNSQDKKQMLWIREITQNARDAIRRSGGSDILSGFFGQGFYTLFAGGENGRTRVRITTGDGVSAYEIWLTPIYDGHGDLQDIRCSMSKLKDPLKGTSISRIDDVDSENPLLASTQAVFANFQAKRLLGAIDSQSSSGVQIYLNGKIINEDAQTQDMQEQGEKPSIFISSGVTDHADGSAKRITTISDPVGMTLDTIVNKLFPVDVSDKPHTFLSPDEAASATRSKFSPEYFNRLSVDGLYIDALTQRYTQLIPASLLKILLPKGWGIDLPVGTAPTKSRTGLLDEGQYLPYFAAESLRAVISLYLRDPSVELPLMPKDYLVSEGASLSVSDDVQRDADLINSRQYQEVDFTLYQNDPHRLIQLLTRIQVELDGHKTTLAEEKLKVLQGIRKGVRAKDMSLASGLSGWSLMIDDFVEKRQAVTIDTKPILTQPILIAFAQFMAILHEKLGAPENKTDFYIRTDAGNTAEAQGNKIRWNLYAMKDFLEPFLAFLENSNTSQGLTELIDTLVHETSHTQEEAYRKQYNNQWTHIAEQDIPGTFGWIMSQNAMRLLNNSDSVAQLRQEFLSSRTLDVKALRASLRTISNYIRSEEQRLQPESKKSSDGARFADGSTLEIPNDFPNYTATARRVLKEAFEKVQEQFGQNTIYRAAIHPLSSIAKGTAMYGSDVDRLTVVHNISDKAVLENVKSFVQRYLEEHHLTAEYSIWLHATEYTHANDALEIRSVASATTAEISEDGLMFSVYDNPSILLELTSRFAEGAGTVASMGADNVKGVARQRLFEHWNEYSHGLKEAIWTLHQSVTQVASTGLPQAKLNASQVALLLDNDFIRSVDAKSSIYEFDWTKSGRRFKVIFPSSVSAGGVQPTVTDEQIEHILEKGTPDEFVNLARERFGWYKIAIPLGRYDQMPHGDFYRQLRALALSQHPKQKEFPGQSITGKIESVDSDASVYIGGSTINYALSGKLPIQLTSDQSYIGSEINLIVSGTTAQQWTRGMVFAQSSMQWQEGDATYQQAFSINPERGMTLFHMMKRALEASQTSGADTMNFALLQNDIFHKAHLIQLAEDGVYILALNEESAQDILQKKLRLPSLTLGDSQSRRSKYGYGSTGLRYELLYNMELLYNYLVGEAAVGWTLDEASHAILMDDVKHVTDDELIVSNILAVARHTSQAQAQPLAEHQEAVYEFFDNLLFTALQADRRQALKSAFQSLQAIENSSSSNGARMAERAQPSSVMFVRNSLVRRAQALGEHQLYLDYDLAPKPSKENIVHLAKTGLFGVFGKPLVRVLKSADGWKRFYNPQGQLMRAERVGNGVVSVRVFEYQSVTDTVPQQYRYDSDPRMGFNPSNDTEQLLRDLRSYRRRIHFYSKELKLDKVRMNTKELIRTFEKLLSMGKYKMAQLMLQDLRGVYAEYQSAVSDQGRFYSDRKVSWVQGYERQRFVPSDPDRDGFSQFIEYIAEHGLQRGTAIGFVWDDLQEGPYLRGESNTVLMTLYRNEVNHVFANEHSRTYYDVAGRETAKPYGAFDPIVPIILSFDVEKLQSGKLNGLGAEIVFRNSKVPVNALTRESKQDLAKRLGLTQEHLFLFESDDEWREILPATPSITETSTAGTVVVSSAGARFAESLTEYPDEDLGIVRYSTKTFAMRYPDLYPLIFDYLDALPSDSGPIELSLLGAGLDETDGHTSSPQLVEIMAALEGRSAHVQVYDMDERVAASVRASTKYSWYRYPEAGRDHGREYSQMRQAPRMRSALARFLVSADPSQFEVQAFTSTPHVYDIDPARSANITVDVTISEFNKVASYAPDSQDMIISTAALGYSFRALNYPERVELLARLVRSLKPGGVLLLHKDDYAESHEGLSQRRVLLRQNFAYQLSFNQTASDLKKLTGIEVDLDIPGIGPEDRDTFAGNIIRIKRREATSSASMLESTSPRSRLFSWIFGARLIAARLKSSEASAVQESTLLLLAKALSSGALSDQVAPVYARTGSQKDAIAFVRKSSVNTKGVELVFEDGEVVSIDLSQELRNLSRQTEVVAKDVVTEIGQSQALSQLATSRRVWQQAGKIPTAFDSTGVPMRIVIQVPSFETEFLKGMKDIFETIRRHPGDIIEFAIFKEGTFVDISGNELSALESMDTKFIADASIPVIHAKIQSMGAGVFSSQSPLFKQGQLQGPDYLSLMILANALRGVNASKAQTFYSENQDSLMQALKTILPNLAFDKASAKTIFLSAVDLKASEAGSDFFAKWSFPRVARIALGQVLEAAKTLIRSVGSAA